jgi:hypothetical protein
MAIMQGNPGPLPPMIIPENRKQEIRERVRNVGQTSEGYNKLLEYLKQSCGETGSHFEAPSSKCRAGERYLG